jgi:hypothetical protein
MQLVDKETTNAMKIIVLCCTGKSNMAAGNTNALLKFVVDLLNHLEM